MDGKHYHNSKFELYLDISLIPNSGLGVFTKNKIIANTLIDEYFGKHMESWGGAYALNIGNGLHIDAYDHPRCYMAMLNDCSYISKKYEIKKNRRNKKRIRLDVTPENYCDKFGKILDVNCYFVIDEGNKKAYVYSLRNVFEGEELFVSYGNSYWGK
jgi:hypothetical protein